MLNNLVAFIVLFSIAVGTAAVIYALVSRSLGALLNEVVRLPAGTVFYLRLFSTSLALIAGSAVLKIQFDLKPGSAFMEYVWKVAGGVSSMFGSICLFLVSYLFVLTILVAVLRRRNDQ